MNSTNNLAEALIDDVRGPAGEYDVFVFVVGHEDLNNSMSSDLEQVKHLDMIYEHIRFYI
jgi:hypothetical protein